MARVVDNRDFRQSAHLSVLPVLAILFSTAAHAKDERDNYPTVFTVSPKGVNIQTGRFTYSKTDLSIGPLNFVRSWGGAPSVLFRPGGNRLDDAYGVWQHSFGQGTYFTSGSTGSFVWVIVEGKKLQFTAASSAPTVWFPWNPDGFGNNLVKVGANWTLTDRSGNFYTFYPHPGIAQGQGVSGSPSQVLSNVVYADGSRLDYSYNSVAQPRTIISNKGYAIVIDYDGAGWMSAVCGYNTAIQYVDANTTCAGASLKVSYSYTQLLSTNQYPALTSVTDTRGNVTSMSYVTSNPAGQSFSNQKILLGCVMLPNTSTCEITNAYGAQAGDPLFQATRWDQVRKQTTATGEVWSYNYEFPYPQDDAPPPNDLSQPNLTYAIMTDPQGWQTQATYNWGLLQTLEGPNGGYGYQFSGTTPIATTLPEGNREVYVRDMRGNMSVRRSDPKSGSGLSSVTTTITYPDDNDRFTISGCIAASPKLCDKPISKVDPRGYQTDYTYDATHGGILTETLPAVGGVRPQTRYFYTQRYAWIKNSGGGFSQAASPVWLLTSKSFCKAGSASGNGCAVAGDEVVTTYDYGPDSGPNNLLLRGTVSDAAGLALRSCFSYDWQGNKISETRPRAVLASCP